jgi:hypothetical protein
MKGPFVSCGNHINFLIKEWEDGSEESKKSVAYRIDDVVA